MQNISYEGDDLNNRHVPNCHIHLEESRVRGLMLGTAIGDALGLPVETFSRDEILKQYGRIESYLAVNANPFFRGSDIPIGTWSDDTQLSVAVAQAVLERGTIDLDRIAELHVVALNQESRGWGGSTKDSIRKIESGVHWSESGRSSDPKRGCGNGVAMKVAPIGAFLLARRESLHEHLDTLANLAMMTHRTSMAVSSGFAQVAAAHYCLSVEPESFNSEHFLEQVIDASRLGRRYLPESLGSDDITEQFELLALKRPSDPSEIAKMFGAGSCYVFHSLPFSYAYFLKNPRSINTLFDTVSGGGDTDSNGAMVGALLGALNGAEIFPRHLVEGIQRSQKIHQIAQELYDQLSFGP